MESVTLMSLRARRAMSVLLALVAVTVVWGAASTVFANEIFPLRGSEGNIDPKDLRPLLKMVKNSPIVGLGESSHASEGYSRAKFYLIQFLVESGGYRRVGIENTWASIEPASRYVRSCQGKPVEALEGLYSVWRNQSVSDLLDWMCHYNQRHPKDPVLLFGFDSQDESVVSFTRLVRYLESNEGAQAPSLIFGLKRCFGFGKDRIEFDKESAEIFSAHAAINPSDQVSCLRGLAKTETLLRRATQIRAAPDQLWEARIAAASVKAYQTELYQWNREAAQAFAARDRGMAELVALFFERHGRRPTLLWAHNEHIALDRPHIQSRLYAGVRGMGSFLRGWYGQGYFPIGLIAYQVGVQWPGQVAEELPLPSMQTSVEGQMQKKGFSQLLMKLPSPMIASGTWWELGREWQIPSAQFGALIFLARSPPMTVFPNL